jgi:hypothetical protein
MVDDVDVEDLRGHGFDGFLQVERVSGPLPKELLPMAASTSSCGPRSVRPRFSNAAAPADGEPGSQCPARTAAT